MAEPDEATVEALKRVLDQVRLDAEFLVAQAAADAPADSHPYLFIYRLGVLDLLLRFENAITKEFVPLFTEED